MEANCNRLGGDNNGRLCNAAPVCVNTNDDAKADTISLEDQWNEFHSHESAQFAESANSDARPLPIATHPSTLPKISMSLKDVDNNDEDSKNALVNEETARNVLPAYQRIAPLTADHIFKIKEVMRGVKINPRSGPIVNIIEKLEGTRIGDENQESL